MSNTLNILPDSRAREHKTDWSISNPGWEWEYLFCASCGKDGGRVLKTYLSREFACYICQNCYETHGHVLGTYVEPDEVFRQKVAAAMQEEYGHTLDETEVLIALEDSTSAISKLEKEK